MAILRALGPAELFISGFHREGFSPEVPLLADDTPGLGPLAGIAAALTTMRSPLLVVLAVDMPAMSTEWLEELLRGCSNDRGIVPRHPDTGFFEPLAAVYPRQCQPLAVAKLAEGDRSLQSFVRSAASLVGAWDIPATQRELFANWNEPGR